MKNVIEVQNLVKTFGDVEAVKGISFEVQEGELFAFLGPNGAGKSTTIAMLTTVLERTGGRVELDGYDPEENPYKARQSFGIVFQDSSHDEDLTAWENMLYHAMLYSVPADARKERITNALTYLDLIDRKDDLVKTFSGGMKRRLEIARALLHEPKILFLDEPTLGLDPQTRNYLWNYVTKLSEEQGMTIFFTTHYMDEAQKFANRIAIIDHGEIKAMGVLDQLMSETGTETLEEAFLELTGRTIRDEGAEDNLSIRARARRGR
jgi:ABC-2 type transport system ATP-binding protein